MTGVFDDINDSEFEKEKDVVGGFKPLPTDVYEGKVKIAYLTQADSGAKCLTLVLDINGKEVSENIYYTSGTEKGGNSYYIDKKTNKKRYLPGMLQLKELCEVISGKPYKDVGKNLVDKIVQIYDKKEKKKVNTTVPVLEDLVGKEVLVAISCTEYPKTDNPKETYSQNSFSKFFDPKTKKCLNEIQDDRPAEFMQEWLDQWKNVVRKGKNTNTTKGKTGSPAASVETDDLFPTDSE